VALDHLWAGWRTPYVESAADTPEEEATSPFISILASGSPDDESHIVWRGTCCFAILNAFPYTSGHLMVMPYREVGTLEELTTPEHAELWDGVTRAVLALKAAYRPDGVNVGVNLGRAAGAGVPSHLHVHVLPRWSGDTNFMTAVAEVRVIPEALSASAAKVRAAWPDSVVRDG
jgi:ATP adenylyltransferase